MHNLFLVYFVNLYMFQAYLGPSPIQSNQHNSQSSKKNNKKYQLLYTYSLSPDDWPKYTQNIYRLMKYTKNMLCIRLVFISTVLKLHQQVDGPSLKSVLLIASVQA